MDLVHRRVHAIRSLGDGSISVMFREGLGETPLKCKNANGNSCTLLCPFAHTGAGARREGVSLFINCVSGVRCTFEADHFVDDFLGEGGQNGR